LSAADGVAFCARGQAEPFLKLRLLQARTKVYEIPESASRFTPGDQAEARLATGLTGDPCVLWVGHLNTNKDPLTVLDGVSLAARHLPGLQLWCCFATAPLLAAARRRIDGDSQLQGRVHLLGRVPHERIESLMRAADLFVLGSHREGCSFSVLEAMACGLPPVVTDIPSFRTLTGDGAAGGHWPCGDAQQLAQLLVQLASQPRAVLRAAARKQFDNELSFAAFGRKLCAAYCDLSGSRAATHGNEDVHRCRETRR
jgi:glycosyltransferase involved in cell wall biosynthesis